MLRAEATKKKGKGGKGAASDLASPLLTLPFFKSFPFPKQGRACVGACIMHSGGGGEEESIWPLLKG